MRLPPELHERHFNQSMQALLEGNGELDSSYGNCPVKLSDFARTNKLLSIVPDLPRVLRYLGIDPEDWRDAERSWYGAPLGDPGTAAKYSLLYSRIDVSDDAAAIAASPAPTTRGLLERGGTVVALGARQVLIIGHVLRDGKAFLRACDLLGRKVLWESASALEPWVVPPPSRSFRVFGTRVILVHERRLTSMKLLDGQEPWTVELPGSEAFPHEEDLKLFHVPLAETPGVVAIEVAGPAGSHTLLAFDEDSGLLLWQLMIPEHSTTVRAIAGAGLILHTMRKQCWAVVHDARSGSILASFGDQDGRGGGWVRRIDVSGPALLLYVGQTPQTWPDAFTLLLVDPRNGRLLEMVQHSSLTRQDRLLEINQRPLWLRWDDKAMGFLWLEPYAAAHARPHGDRWERWISIDKVAGEPAPQAQAIVTDEAIVIAYDVIVRGREATGSSGVLLFMDRRTLTPTREIRLKGSVAIPQEGRDALAARGSFLSLTVSGGECGQLSVFDLRTGQQLWEMPVPGWRSQRFLGVWLLITTRTGWLLIEPESGTLVASWPLDG